MILTAHSENLKESDTKIKTLYLLFTNLFIIYLNKTPSLSQEIQNVPIFKCFFPALDYLTLADITQRLISSLDGFQLRPQDISVRSNEVSQPLNQNNIIIVNQETSATKRTRTLIPQLKEHQLKAT